MKQLVVACILALSTASTYAAGEANCRKIEYAELKDTPTNELLETYCAYAIARKVGSDGYISAAKSGFRSAALAEAGNNCFDQLANIAQILKRRNVTVPEGISVNNADVPKSCTEK